VEAGVERAEADSGALQSTFEGAMEAGAVSLESFAGLGQGLAGIVAEDGRGEGGDVILLAAQMCGEGSFLSEDKVVEALGLAMNQCRDARFGSADRQTREAPAGEEKPEADGAREALILRGKMLGDFVLGLGDELSGGGGGWCAQVGYKIGDGEVGLMSYRGNDREVARCNRAGDTFGVECGQVFERAAAAGEDDEVDQAG